jgi:Rho guanine nucleotide exchange factor 4
MRAEVIKEIISTERDYVKHLHIIYEVFLLPLKLRGIMTPEDVNVVFGNIEMCLSCNSQLLKDWDARTRHSNTKDEIIILGEIFQKMVPDWYLTSNFFSLPTSKCTQRIAPTSQMRF